MCHDLPDLATRATSLSLVDNPEFLPIARVLDSLWLSCILNFLHVLECLVGLLVCCFKRVQSSFVNHHLIVSHTSSQILSLPHARASFPRAVLKDNANMTFKKKTLTTNSIFALKHVLPNDASGSDGNQTSGSHAVPRVEGPGIKISRES